MQPSKSFRIAERVGVFFVLLLSLVALTSAVRRAASSARILTVGWKEPAKADPFEDRYFRRPMLSLVHSMAGILFITTGPIQFSAVVRKRWLRLHRICGRIFILAGLVGAATAIAFLAVLPVFGHFTSKTATTFGACYFLVAITMAYIRIRQRRIQAHREWMIRSYALGLAIATFRVLLGVLVSPPASVPFVEAWDTVMWLGFVINASVAEIWIHATRPVRIPAAASPREALANPSV